MAQRYQTKKREVILAFLRAHPERCFSAKELYTALHGTPICPGETTVYRTLELLSHEGTIKRFEQGQGKSATYQFADENPACEHHLHLKCRDCGVLIHAECTRLKSLAEHLCQEHGFTVNQTETVLYGTCQNCREEP
ncbi:MAG: transcriptional repressor [Clostridia bacterium]|nr:transcriptional repressor [Clostridia bacterium]